MAENHLVFYIKDNKSHHQFLNCSLAPSFLKPDSISQKHKNIELDVSKATDLYWPAFKDNNYELQYCLYDTVNHYLLMTHCFKLSIHNLLEYYDKTYDKYNVIFLQNIAKPSDKNQMPLMNEIIFFPALNTLIESINNVDSKILMEVHTELTHITSNGTYLSNNKLSNLYSLSVQKNY